MAEDKGGRPYEGEPRTAIISEEMWRWLSGLRQQRLFSEYVRRLIKRDRDERNGQTRKDLDDLEPLDAEERGAR